MSYADESKAQAIARYRGGESAKEVCEAFGISRSTLYRWVKQNMSIEAPHRITAREYYELKRRNEKLENMLSITKAAPCLASAPLKERLAYAIWHALQYIASSPLLLQLRYGNQAQSRTTLYLTHNKLHCFPFDSYCIFYTE